MVIHQMTLLTVPDSMPIPNRQLLVVGRCGRWATDTFRRDPKLTRLLFEPILFLELCTGNFE